MNKAHKILLRQRFDGVADEYVEAFCRQMDIDKEDGYWAGGEVGGIYCFLDTESITLLDMIYVVENDIPRKELLEWTDYNAFAHRFNQNHINLKSWHRGCPHINDDERQRMEDLHDELEVLVDAMNDKYKQ